MLKTALWASLTSVAIAHAGVPENLVLDGIPAIPQSLRASVVPYLESRAAVFRGWHPTRREMLITTRFADTAQLHLVRMPGGARRQLTFSSEPVGDASFRPGTGDCIVFSQDVGGGEFYQLYRYDVGDGQTTLLTDGKSRNTGMKWSHAGRLLAYTSTRRNGRDNDLYVVAPEKAETTRLVLPVEGGGWSVEDWSPDDSQWVVQEYLSINESRLYLVDVSKGSKELLTPVGTGPRVSHAQARFARDGHSIYVTTDKDSEFLRLAQLNLATKEWRFFQGLGSWDVSEFEVSPDGRQIAIITNEGGVSKLRLLETATEGVQALAEVPAGVLTGLKWHEDGKSLAFTLASARSPSDAYVVRFDGTAWRLQRWTESETGGLNPERFVEPELVQLTGAGGVQISAFVYRPDASRFPGKRPAIVNIHGGPESQARPIFQARNNYLINELGIALIFPNVRGSAGYGKTFLGLDNGMQRLDSVRDIGVILDWVKADARLNAERVAVVGGSYGGYMVLASLVEFGERLRCGVDVVGISNFLTFLKNTQEYRRDLRRAEYGDERDEAMRQFLERISPVNNVSKIRQPLLVVQGQNDPRVPVGESEQMVKALRAQQTPVWYLLAKDEGHGFAKKPNADVQFLATILFLRQHLLE